MLSGFIPAFTGKIIGNGRIAYFSDENLISTDTLYNNLTLLDKTISRYEAYNVCMSLDIFNELDISNGLDSPIEPRQCRENQLKLIALARILCSKAGIYILDRPFAELTFKHASNVESILNKRQKEGVIIIMALLKVTTLEPKDKVIIVRSGKTIEMGLFGDILKKPGSEVQNYIKKAEVEAINDQNYILFKQIIVEFQNKVRKSLICEALSEC